MATTVLENHYGKSSVRLVKVERNGAQHSVRDLTLDIQLSGEFAAAYRDGDNRLILPTDTMKNTVYAFARRQTLGEIEEFGKRLAAHFLERNPPVSEAKIRVSEAGWNGIRIGGQDYQHAFLRHAEERRIAVIHGGRAGLSVIAGIANLVVLKTSGSAFEGYLHDEYTTLNEARDRLLSTAVKAEWTYEAGASDYGVMWRRVRETILEVFAGHHSLSVQHTLYAIGETVLNRIPEITRIELSLPNRHCLLVDLAPFGLDNPNEVFVPAAEPYGVIQAVLTRS